MHFFSKYKHCNSHFRTFSSGGSKITGYSSNIYPYLYFFLYSIVHSAPTIPASSYMEQNKRKESQEKKKTFLSDTFEIYDFSFHHPIGPFGIFFPSRSPARGKKIGIFFPPVFISILFSSAIFYFRGNQRLSVMILGFRVVCLAFLSFWKEKNVFVSVPYGFVLLFYI